MGKLVVVGAGVMGLSVAYHALKAGHSVEILEASPTAGGMAAHFDLAGISIERFYHFICKTDVDTFELAAELGIADKLRWQKTSMGYFSDGQLYPWGDPVALLRYPNVSLLSRLRYGLLAWLSTRRDRWDALEDMTAREWIVRWCGTEVYEHFWRRLLELKFHGFADHVSARWIWTRMRRTGRSRTSAFQEELGYFEGGSQTLVDALLARIQALGGSVSLATPASEIAAEAGRVTGVRTANGFSAADAVVSTMPTPLVADTVPALPDEWKDRYRAIDNIGVCCVVMRLKRPVTPHFWVNVVDAGMEIPGFIEFSNLRPLPDAVVFVPYYMPTSHPKFGWTDEALAGEAFAYLQKVNPSLSGADLIASHVGRLRFAQPVCGPGFEARIPPTQTPIAGLQIADTCYYYPEDRGISESVRLGRSLAAAIGPRVAGGSGQAQVERGEPERKVAAAARSANV